VADYADALLSGTRQTIIEEGERLYSLTKKEDGNGGAQVVVATFLLEDGEYIESINRSDLFNQWRIGKNDMGVLILMIFENQLDETDGETYLTLIDTEIELGYQMEQYISAAKAAELIQERLYNPEWDGSLDMGLAELYYEVLSIIYTKAYGYESFNYDMEEHREFVIAYQDEAQVQVPMGLIAYLFSPYASVSSKFFLVLGFLILTLSGGGGFFLFKRNSGGGGSSGGYGIRH